MLVEPPVCLAVKPMISQLANCMGGLSGFMASGYGGGVWSNPLAAAMIHQQQEAARKVLQSANGKSPRVLGLLKP